jgi:serine protease Do
MAVLDELGQAIGDVGRKASASVVRVGGGWRGGSGVVIGPGAVLTNAHNLRGDEIVISFADGRHAEASVSGIDVDSDLAVLSVDTADAPALEWSTETPEVGTPVFAAAAGGGGTRVTFGFASGLARAFRGPRGRRISGSLEHTAPLAPGSSGGPLLDGQGRIVGINTNRLGSGFYLALPADESLRQRVAALQRGESAERPRLGVGIAPSWLGRRMRRAVGLPEREGVLVRDVEDDSPAEQAGIVEGDLIVEAGGRPIREPDDVYEALGDVAPDATLSLRIVRGTEERTVEAHFATDTEAGAGGPVH